MGQELEDREERLLLVGLSSSSGSIFFRLGTVTIVSERESAQSLAADAANDSESEVPPSDTLHWQRILQARLGY